MLIIVCSDYLHPAINGPQHTLLSDQAVEHLVQQLVDREGLPGMWAAVTNHRGLLAAAVYGKRKFDSNAPLKRDDQIHIGSCTKAMTSALIGVLVDKGKLKWDDQLLAVIPELKDSVHGDYASVTLWDLLTHRGGIPAHVENWWIHQKLPLRERRMRILHESLTAKPRVPKGDYVYSNLSYMAAAVMAEKVMGSSWESLIQQLIFKPLEMNSCGFGPPGSEHLLDQPFGHVKDGNIWQPRFFDNAPALGPAGRVHCQLTDWSKFLAIYLPQSRQQLLKPNTLQKLMTPNGSYAGGWVVGKRTWAQGMTLSHNGSNTMWYVTAWIAPEINRCFITATNSCSKQSHALCDELIGQLIHLNAKK